MEVKDLKLSAIKVSEFNTRKDLDAGSEDAGLEDLANSIKEKGLLNPIIVRMNNDGSYGLIAGQRRFLACQRLGWETIPSIVRDIASDTDATIISLIENVQRADMNPIDKARAYKKIFESYKDYNIVAKETGVSVSTLKKYTSLLNLAPSIQDKLTTAEYTVIQDHPVIGENILKPMLLFDREREIILHHHERWDGTGYPHGLSGNEIPYLSRILSVADSFDAMITDRPYRKAMSIETALDELKRNRLTQFDPEILHCFLATFPA